MGLVSTVVNYEQTIRNYGTAITVGVFIGSALTTGCLLGAATYWAISKNIVNVLGTQFGTKLKTQVEKIGLTSGEKHSDLVDQQQSMDIKNLQKQIDNLQITVFKLVTKNTKKEREEGKKTDNEEI